MKRTAILLSTALLLAGCSHFNSNGTAGNPGGLPYAGEEGSVFDASAGPNRPVRPEVYERLSPEKLLPPSLAPAPAR